MAVSIDIKFPGVEDQARHFKEIADQTDRIGAAEKKANGEHLRASKNAKAIGDTTRKALGDHKKTTEEEAKQKKTVTELAASWYLIKEGAKLAYDSVIGLGHSLLQIGYEAERSKSGAKAMMDVFTNGRGAETLRILDGEARKLGQSVDDVRKDFVAFSEAGLTNNMANNLIKLKADLMSTGMTAKDVGFVLQNVLGAGHDVAKAQQEYNYVINRFSQQKGFEKIGSGAMAAAYAAHSVGAAMNQLGDAATEKLGELWGKIGPSIGHAARALADFVTHSPEVKEAVAGISNAIADMTKAVNGDNLKKAFGFMKETAVAVKNAFEIAADIAKKLAGPDETKGGSNAANSTTSVAKALSSGEALSQNTSGIAQFFTGAVQAAQIAMGDYKTPEPQAPLSKNKAPQFSNNSPGAGTIVIQNLTVGAGAGSPSDMARSIRQELQLLLQSFSLNKPGVPNASP